MLHYTVVFCQQAQVRPVVLLLGYKTKTAQDCPRDRDPDPRTTSLVAAETYLPFQQTFSNSDWCRLTDKLCTQALCTQSYYTERAVSVCLPGQHSEWPQAKILWGAPNTSNTSVIEPSVCVPHTAMQSHGVDLWTDLPTFACKFLGNAPTYFLTLPLSAGSVKRGTSLSDHRPWMQWWGRQTDTEWLTDSSSVTVQSNSLTAANTLHQSVTNDKSHQMTMWLQP